jgi:hypothetical protein
LGSEIDFSQLAKIYGNTEENQKRNSPAQCIGTEKIKINGNPEGESISTSYIERQNLTMRNEYEALYKAYKCLFQKGGELGPCPRSPFYVL